MDWTRDGLVQRLTLGKEVVSISIDETSSRPYIIVFGERHLDGAVTVVRVETLDTFEDLEPHLGHRAAAVNLWCTDSMVREQVETKQTQELALTNLLPGSNPEDFWLSLDEHSSTAYLTVERIEVIEEIMKRLNAIRCVPANFDLGPGPAIRLAADFYSEREVGLLATFPTNDETSLPAVLIDGVECGFRELAAVAVLLGGSAAPPNQQQLLSAYLRRKYSLPVFGTLLGLGVLGAILSFSIANPLSKVQVKLDHERRAQRNFSQEAELVEARRSEYESYGILGASRVSYFADRITHALSSVRLEELHLYPPADLYTPVYDSQVATIRMSIGDQPFQGVINKLTALAGVVEVDVLNIETSGDAEPIYTLSLELSAIE